MCVYIIWGTLYSYVGSDEKDEGKEKGGCGGPCFTISDFPQIAMLIATFRHIKNFAV